MTGNEKFLFMYQIAHISEMQEEFQQNTAVTKTDGQKKSSTISNGGYFKYNNCYCRTIRLTILSSSD
jgi:hypothetical protein